MAVYPKLGVNIDHVATVRQARRAKYPDPVFAASIAEQNGADQITLHLREDRRHIQDHDLRRMREAIQTRMNLEMAATEEMLGIACQTRPDIVSLVPEKRQEVTTEGGLEVAGQLDHIRRCVGKLEGAGIPTSLFIDPDERQIEATKKTGAIAIEIHTGAYCETGRQQELDRIANAARYAASLGLKVFAGHGLDYHNVTQVAQIREIEEFNIGYSIVSRAIFTGFADAVQEMKRLLLQARQS